MTTDITELAQRMKAAAEKTTQGEWRRASTQFNGITATPFMLGRKEVIIAGASEKRDAEFIALANPENVLALVDALEKAQQPVVPDEAYWNQVTGRDGFKFTEGWNACRAAMLQGSQPVSNRDELPEEKGASLQLRNLIRRHHAEWSQATFGDVGPVGPLKHLSKEALEAAAEPDDLSEWADMQFLMWDAQRRAGITDEQITQAMIEKLEVNKLREWPEPKDGEPRLHIKEQPAPEYPETLPCPVLLEPGMRFGKGVKTRLVLDAIQRRAEHYAELEAMTPEERAEYDANIEAFKAMLPQPAPELTATVERLNASGYEYEGGEVTPQNIAAVVDILLQQLDDAVQGRDTQPAPVVLENCVTAEHRRVIEMLLNVCGAAFELADDSCQQDVDGEDCHVVPNNAFQKLSDMLDEIENSLPTEDADRPDVFLAWAAMPRASLKSLLQAGNSPVIPDGYVMVPESVTPAMAVAGGDVFVKSEQVSEYPTDAARNIYRAMLAAAPQEPKP